MENHEETVSRTMSTWDYLCFTMNQSMAMQLIFTEEQTVHYFNF